MKTTRLVLAAALILLVSAGLFACGSSSPLVTLPLADGKPTFLYFFTES
ncbi:MAG: hypothetical protein K8J31_08385 [Anaerolineae bacterium]|nr:hypothetical protein [Anaerolineae bacterium]